MANVIDYALTGLETTLDQMTQANGYNYTIGNSTPRTGSETLDNVTGDRPHVYIVGVEDISDRFSTSWRFKKLGVRLRGITPGVSVYDLKTECLKLWADIESVIYADVTLSGNVTQAVYDSGDMDFSRETSHGVVDLEFELHIHHKEGSA